MSKFPDSDPGTVSDDEGDLYGKNYFKKHLSKDYGYPAIKERVRNDLPERNLYWLDALLRLKKPEGRLLELGCFHGGFVALARLAGFDAAGLELSPAICAQARRLFEIEVLEGPLQAQVIADESLTAVAHFDVLEHLWDPLGTMKLCRRLMKPTGVMLLQTPCYPEGTSYEELRARNDPFLIQLKPMEHLFLFSQRSVKELLKKAGLTHVRFETPIFAHYDMFLAASAEPLRTIGPASRTRWLESSPTKRTVLALLDLNRERSAAGARSSSLEKDAAELRTNLAESQERLRAIDADRRKLNELAQRERSEHKKSVESLRADISSLTKSIATAEHRSAALDLQLREVNKLADQQAVAASMTTAAFEERIASLNASLSQRDKQLAELDSDRAELNKLAREQAKESANAISSLEKQIEALVVEARDREKRLADIDTDRGKLNKIAREQAATIAKQSAQIESLGPELADRDRRITEIAADRDGLNELARNQAEESTRRLANAESQITALNSAVALKEQMLAELDADRKKLNELARAQSSESASLIAHLERQISLLSGKLNEQDRLVAEIDADRARGREIAIKQANEASAEIERLNEVVSASQDKQMKLAAIVSERDERIRHMESLITDRSKRISDLEILLEGSISTEKSLESQLGEATRSLEEAKSDAETYARMRSDADTAIVQISSETVVLTKRARALEKSLESADSSHVRLAGELARVEDAFDGLRARHDELVKRIETLSDSLRASEKERNLGVSEVGKLRDQLTQLRQSRWGRLGRALRALPPETRD